MLLLNFLYFLYMFIKPSDKVRKIEVVVWFRLGTFQCWKYRYCTYRKCREISYCNYFLIVSLIRLASISGLKQKNRTFACIHVCYYTKLYWMEDERHNSVVMSLILLSSCNQNNLTNQHKGNLSTHFLFLKFFPIILKLFRFIALQVLSLHVQVRILFFSC